MFVEEEHTLVNTHVEHYLSEKYAMYLKKWLYSYQVSCALFSVIFFPREYDKSFLGLTHVSQAFYFLGDTLEDLGGKTTHNDAIYIISYMLC